MPPFFFAVPTENNEAILGMDLALYPERISAIREAYSTNETVVSSPIILRQTNRTGLVIRTPLALPNDRHGLVSTAIDITSLLEESGLQPSRFELLVKLRHPKHNHHMVHGEQELFRQLSQGFNILLPGEASLEVRCKVNSPPDKEGYSQKNWIRFIGALLTTLVLISFLKRHGLLSGMTIFHRQITLRLALLLLTVLPIILLIFLVEARCTTHHSRKAGNNY